MGRLVLLHRVGVVPIGESAVVVAASAPHRDEAFDAARYAIDTLKATVPVWKREAWEGGESWGLEAQHIREVEPVPGVHPPAVCDDAGVPIGRAGRAVSNLAYLGLAVGLSVIGLVGAVAGPPPAPLHAGRHGGVQPGAAGAGAARHPCPAAGDPRRPGVTGTHPPPPDLPPARRPAGTAGRPGARAVAAGERRREGGRGTSRDDRSRSGGPRGAGQRRRLAGGADVVNALDVAGVDADRSGPALAVRKQLLRPARRCARRRNSSAIGAHVHVRTDP